MLATRSWDRKPNRTGRTMPSPDLRAATAMIARHAADIPALFQNAPTILVEEAGTAFLVTRADADEIPLFLHAHPGEIEIGVAEEHDYPLLSVVVSVRTPGAPRNAGIIFDVADFPGIEGFRRMIGQPFVDLVVLDPALRPVAAFRFELTLWSRARAHRSLDQARRHMETIPAERRNFRRALEILDTYINQNQTA